MLGLPVPLKTRNSESKRPKGINDCLRDPGLYKSSSGKIGRSERTITQEFAFKVMSFGTRFEIKPTMFSFISGIFIYIVAWGLLGQDKSDDLGPHSLPEFLYLACILSGTGVFLAAIFHIGVREPKTRVRRKSTINSLMNAPGIFLNAFGSQNADTRRRSIAYNFVDMILATTEYEEKQSEMSGCEESRGHEGQRRKRSLLQKFVDALFYDGETDNNSQNQDQLQSATEETTKNPKSEDAQTPVFLEVQHLDPERKRSLLMRVVDGLVFRLQQEEQVQLTCINGIGDQIAKDGEYDECVTGENFWKAGEEEIESAPDESEWELTNNVSSAKDKNGNEEEGIYREDQNETSVDDSTQNFPKQDCMEELGNDREDQNESIPETSFRTKRNQRKRGIAHFPVGSKCGLSNSGFEGDESDSDRKRSVSSKLEGKRRKSVHFSSSEFSGKLSMDEIERQSLNLDYTPKKKTSLEECTQNYPKEDCREDVGIETYESRNESSAGGDNPELLGVPVPLTNGERGPERKQPKGIKEWLRDPGLYKVAIIFACSRHALDLTNTYLPLFLTETLLLPKESTAYFPLILLICASLASSASNKLNNKIGSKWSYLLAGLLVMGGAVWSYFQTVSTRQSFYAPVVIIGSGMSIMHVMALVFIMELIGENKENSGSVFAIIDVITRVSNGLILLGIQEFYPNEGTSSKDAVTNYVRLVFALTAGILALVGSLVVLFFQPSKFVHKTKASQDVEDQPCQPSFDVQVLQCPAEEAASINSPDTYKNNQTVTVHSCSENTKL
ncbi:Major facilitator superfamily domain-containing protein 12 [Stylophora pistillata]|uniref:Major facilitator superfamily domain-containing protein 12 n=1 Tax=Stylophora pistillata TaxID=50429 RepID=A0A2B4S338_STYPI|nr:Major facilitator superfamily domain-containing protein 12 [Stylophora pistillata]